MNLPSKTLEDAIEAIASLPGIGKKTALRLALHLLKEEDSSIFNITQSIGNLKKDIKYCKQCHNISDDDVCSICSSAYREDNVICVVEDLRDVIAIENTAQFQGKYHVLGGVISPMEGIGPSDLNVESLILKCDKIEEIILALPSTMEGDTTAFYIQKKIKDFDVKISTLARGIPIGGELEYADEVTLGRSIVERVNYDK